VSRKPTKPTNRHIDVSFADDQAHYEAQIHLLARDILKFHIHELRDNETAIQFARRILSERRQGASQPRNLVIAVKISPLQAA
jgi:hypothetical protein